MEATPQTFIRGRRYTLEADLKPILDGKVLLPNFEPITAESAVYSAAYWYGEVNNGRAKLSDNFPGQALFFFKRGQGGGFTGEGMVMATQFAGGRSVPIAGNFAICKHEKAEGAGANHDRGWHPGHCKLCGLDMSVDSGD